MRFFYYKFYIFVKLQFRIMGKITFVTVKDKKGTIKKMKGTIIVKNPIVITEGKKIGNTTKKSTTKKTRRQIQYVDNLDSIYLDEQIKENGGEKPTPDPVYIVKGKLDIEEDKTNLYNFLIAHTDNIINGGKIFKLYEVDKEDEIEVERFTFTTRVCNEIMEADKEVAHAIAVWFLGVKYAHLTVNKVKKALYLRCQSDYAFTEKVDEFLKDNTKEHKLMITLALSNNIIKIRDGNKIAWADSDTSDNLYLSSNADDLVAEFSTYLKTDKEGRETLKLIAKKLEKSEQ